MNRIKDIKSSNNDNWLFGDRFRRNYRNSISGGGAFQRARRQRSEQYLTSSHTRSHFLRHEKDRPQAGHIFAGRFAFAMALPGDRLSGMGAGGWCHAQIKAQLCWLRNLLRKLFRRGLPSPEWNACAFASVPRLDLVGMLAMTGALPYGK